MVNTFIICSNFQKNFKYLDRQRLGKQRVEAYQILNILLDAKLISKVFNYSKQPKVPTPDTGKDFLLRVKWLQDIYTKYKKENTCLVVEIITGKIFRIDRSEIKKYGKEFRKISGGFYNHPMTHMWIGYENGLKHYINLCIDEWICRGYKNNMKTYDLTDKTIVLPFWINCKVLYYSHRSALYRKEIVRKEKAWYQNIKKTNKIQNTIWMKQGYLWLSHISEEKIDRLMKGEILTNVCDEIKNDFME